MTAVTAESADFAGTGERFGEPSLPLAPLGIGHIIIAVTLPRSFVFSHF